MSHDVTSNPALSQTTGSPAAEAPKRGFLLSLVAIGLLLKALSSLQALVALAVQPGGIDESRGLVVLVGVTIALALATLVALLTRRRLFLYLFAALLLYSLAVDAGLYLSGTVEIARNEAIASIAVQTLLAALWLTYLVRSQHVRQVCCK